MSKCLHSLQPTTPSLCRNVVQSQAPIILPVPRLLLLPRRHTAAAYHEAASSDDCDDGNRRKAARSPCSIRYKCRSLVDRIGRCRRQGHVAASEFGYDPMSYALYFEDDWSWESDEEFPARNFSARLPAPPDRLLPGKLPREVVACS